MRRETLRSRARAIRVDLPHAGTEFGTTVWMKFVDTSWILYKYFEDKKK